MCNLLSEVYPEHIAGWADIGELPFNMPVCVGAVKMTDRVVCEMMGLCW